MNSKQRRQTKRDERYRGIEKKADEFSAARMNDFCPLIYEKFDREFNIIEVTEEEERGTGRFEAADRLKDGCGISREFGLYCEVRELR